MTKLSIFAASIVNEADLKSAKFGPRFGRLDLQSQLALLAVESLKINFENFSRDRIAIFLAASAGSLTTDFNFWQGRDAIGGPSPTLFAYTLPSAAIGEIAIHFKLTGPHLCFVGGDKNLLREAEDLILRHEADACVCIFCEVISDEVAKIISAKKSATACAIFLKCGEGLCALTEIDRDMKSLCAATVIA